MAGPLTRWAVWRLPLPLRAYLLAVVALAVGACAATLPGLFRDPGRPAYVLLVVGGGLVGVELTRRLGRRHGTSSYATKDTYSVWFAAGVLLLPAGWCALLPVLLYALAHCRVYAGIPHRRVFSVAQMTLAALSARAVAGAVVGGLPPGGGVDPDRLVLAGTAGAATFLVLNYAAVAAAVRLGDPDATLEDLVGTLPELVAEAAVLATGVLLALAALQAPSALPLLLAVVVALHWSTVHADLLSAARTDGLTGLLNGAAWRTEVAAGLRSRPAGAVVLLDLDRFKAVNDSLGHATGDAVLRATADALRAAAPGGLVGRLGGEEFGVWLPDRDGPGALDTAERLRGAVRSAGVPVGGHRLTVTASLGVAVPAVGEQAGLGDLLARADEALYAAKAAGRDRVAVAAAPAPRRPSDGPSAAEPGGEAGAAPAGERRRRRHEVDLR